MADETTDSDKNEGEEEGNTPKSSKLKWILLITLPIVLLGGGAGGYFFLQSGEQTDTDVVTAVSAEQEKAPKFTTIQYHPLKEEFTVNVSSNDGKNHYMRLSVTLMTRDQDLIGTIKELEPIIRNDLLTLFSSQSFEYLKTTEGKELLRKDALKAAKGAIGEPDKAKKLQAVLFTQFVME